MCLHARVSTHGCVSARTCAPVCVDRLCSLPFLLLPLPPLPPYSILGCGAQDPWQSQAPSPTSCPPLRCSEPLFRCFKPEFAPNAPGRWDSGQGHPSSHPSTSTSLSLEPARSSVCTAGQHTAQVKGLVSVGPSGSLHPLMKEELSKEGSLEQSSE